MWSVQHLKQAGLLANMDLLPRTGILQQNIYAPSVFSTSKWCRQRLTVSELMDIFDFEDCIKRGILKHVESPSLAFVKEPPGKLLHRLMSSERVPLVATVVDGEDDLSFKSEHFSRVSILMSDKGSI